MKEKRNKLFLIFLAIAVVQAACSLPGKLTETAPTDTATAPSPTETSQPPTPTPDLALKDIYAQPFAAYNQIAVNLPAVFNGGGYSLPFDLNQLQFPEGLNLSAAQKALLSANGFVVTTPFAGQYQEFYQIYEYGRYGTNPAFITTDSVFHVYHLIFDKMLRDLETQNFISTLRLLTPAMLTTSTQQYQSLHGTVLEEPALRNVAYFGVADRLLGLNDPIPAEAQGLVDAELALINDASSESISPIWDRPDLPPDQKLIEVYGQYKPRGHYTRSEDLKMYFKAMMWYGRLTFRLMDPFETRRALLVTQALRTTTAADGTPAATLWANIYDPTAFIVGKADDLGYHEYGALSDQVFGASPDLLAFADETLFARFMDASKSLPPPQINSMWVWIWQDQETVTKGFRFMGQRFTLDAYVFGQLIWRKVGTEAQPRNLPKGLDFFAAMGSKEADTILAEMGENQFLHFDTQMTKVKGEIAGLGMDSWAQNLYWNWLYAFQPIIAPKDTRYPPFMQTQAWTRKDLQTALGSWTELKHDTILYAKQVMAEMGGGPGDMQPPHGYVEPNPEAYARLFALCQMTYDGLQSRTLLSDLTRSNLENLMGELTFLKDMAERELAGQPVSDDDYWHINRWGGILEHMTLAAADTEDGMSRDLSDQKAALIADVATGPGEAGLVALEEAIGQPTYIYVILPDSPWRIGIGAVYTYYEFTVPSGQRMTDEEWQAQVQAGTNPPQPSWTDLFIAK
jgi:hypothetical protein